MSGETKTPVLRFPDALPWTRKRFGDFGTLRRGLTYSPVDCRARGVRVLRSSNIDEDVFALHEDDVFVCKQAANIPFAKNGDILITSANGSSHLVGKHAIVRGLDEQSAVHGGFMLLAESDTPDFLNAAMGAPWYKDFVASNMLGGNGALGNLSKPVFEKCFFFAPSSTTEQQSIGRFFRELDALIAEREKALGKLESLKKAMLEKMFPQGDAKVPEVRFKGFEGEWEEKKFETAASRKSSLCDDLDLPRLEYEDVVSFCGVLNKNIFQKQSTKTGIPFSTGNVLFGKLRPYLGNWFLPEFDGLAVGDWWVLQPKTLDPAFLFSFIQTNSFQKIANQSTGSKMPRADWNLVSNSVFLFPSLPEQQEIGSFFRSLDALLAARREEAEKLKQLKKAFLERMFA